MGFLSWLLGRPGPRKKGKAAPARTAPAIALSREELIQNALKIRDEKKREFDKLDPEARLKLLRQAMGKKDADDEA
jgi:hypothetical protein